MNFARAVEYMKQGEAVKQKEGTLLYSLNTDTNKLQRFDKKRPHRGVEDILFMNVNKILANDWELVE